MKRIRGLVLAALAAMALSASFASAPASASVFPGPGVTATKYPATLNAETTQDLKFWITGYSTECSTSPLDFETTLTEPVTTLASTGSEFGCKPGGEEIEAGECTFELDPGGRSGVKVGPEGCGSMTWFNYQCWQTIEIPEGSKADADYEVVGVGKEAYVAVDVEGNFSYSTPKGGFCHGAGEYNDLFAEAEVKLTGTDASENPVGVQAITGGLFMEGEGSLAAYEYPAGVTGYLPNDVLPAFVAVPLEMEAEAISCEAAEFDSAELTEAVGTYSVTPSYSECLFDSLEFPEEIDMNSCVYEYSNITQVDSTNYKSDASISCEGEDEIKIADPFGYCQMYIPPQALNEPAITLNGPFSGEARLFGRTLGSGLEYTVEGPLCEALGLTEGTHEDGGMKVHSLLRGVF